MDSLSAVIYGLIQGITEFLPVSSSGHLALIPKFLTIKDPGVLFDLSMHVGTALSIIIYFSKDVLSLIKCSFLVLKNPRELDRQKSWAANMMLATAVTFLFVLILKSFAEQYAREPHWIGINLIVFGVIMFLADFFAPKDAEDQMTVVSIKRSFLIGLSQALAIFPGVSRSGATLSMARFLGLSRHEATRFSFLLSLPIILAGFFYKLPSLLSSGNDFDWQACIIGMVISFLVGLLTIHFFLKIIKKQGLGIFSIYRVALAIVVFIYL